MTQITLEVSELDEMLRAAAENALQEHLRLERARTSSREYNRQRRQIKREAGRAELAIEIAARVAQLRPLSQRQVEVVSGLLSGRITPAQVEAMRAQAEREGQRPVEVSA